MSKITGRAKKYDGTAIDYVSIFNWTDGKCLAQVKPKESGAWTYQYYTDINIGITYVADGCEPITHGAYSFTGIWGPEALFANTEKGVFYNPSDLSTLFQDAAGTTPVTEDGQPVGLIKDLSGNNYHARQSALNARPIYKTDGILHWLYFDGIDDFLVAEYSLQSPKHLISASVHLLRSNNQQGILECFGDNEFSANWHKKGSRILFYSGGFKHQIGDGVNRYATPQPFVDAPTALIARVNERVVGFWRDGSLQSATHAGAMRVGRKTYIGINDSSVKTPANMNFYGALVLERNTTESEFSEFKSYMSELAGIT